MFTPSIRLTIIICVGFLALLGCSKTADTSPETRVFGDPPVITAVAIQADQNAIASCDMTNMFLNAQEFCDDAPILMGPLIVESSYTEVILTANVTDPDDPDPPSTATDVILVTASYISDAGAGTPQEDSIVLFDDGSSVGFPFLQKFGQEEGCTFDPVGRSCTCNRATYQVTSNDLAPGGDDTFTRGFAFAPGGNIPANMEALYLDCIAAGNAQASQIKAGLANRQIEFRIEAVDKSGNLAASPIVVGATVGAGGLTCTGDPCACCLMLNQSNPGASQANGGCRDLDGLAFDDSFSCTRGDPALFGIPCSVNSECDGTTGGGRCRQSTWGRNCPTGFCKSTTCLP